MGKLTILAIDDNNDCNELVKLILERDTNWQILTASNGKEGIELARIYQPEIILLDLAMPEMDGVEVYQILKSNSKTSSAVIIFFTAMPQMSRKIKERIGEDVEIIAKLLDITPLSDRISKIYNRYQQRNRDKILKHK